MFWHVEYLSYFLLGPGRIINLSLSRFLARSRPSVVLNCTMYGNCKIIFLVSQQVAVETVVLQEENGSMTQRVQAEFLSELCKRIEKACPEQQPGIP